MASEPDNILYLISGEEAQAKQLVALAERNARTQLALLQGYLELMDGVSVAEKIRILNRMAAGSLALCNALDAFVADDRVAAFQRSVPSTRR